MSIRNISIDYVQDLCARIEQGETPRKNDALSPKEFIRQVLPHVKNFLAQGYSYKEIAAFLGHVSHEDLKKAVAKEAPARIAKKVAKPGQTDKTTAPAPGQKRKSRQTPQPGA
jgi:hypothetical protein